MWKFKSTVYGGTAPAVLRRLNNCKVDLADAASRSKFGYNYLEYVSNEKV
jgi:hypothetical protein